MGALNFHAEKATIWNHKIIVRRVGGEVEEERGLWGMGGQSKELGVKRKENGGSMDLGCRLVSQVG